MVDKTGSCSRTETGEGVGLDAGWFTKELFGLIDKISSSSGRAKGLNLIHLRSDFEALGHKARHGRRSALLRAYKRRLGEVPGREARRP